MVVSVASLYGRIPAVAHEAGRVPLGIDEGLDLSNELLWEGDADKTAVGLCDVNITIIEMDEVDFGDHFSLGDVEGIDLVLIDGVLLLDLLKFADRLRHQKNGLAECFRLDVGVGGLGLQTEADIGLPDMMKREHVKVAQMRRQLVAPDRKGPFCQRRNEDHDAGLTEESGKDLVFQLLAGEAIVYIPIVKHGDIAPVKRLRLAAKHPLRERVLEAENVVP